MSYRPVSKGLGREGGLQQELVFVLRAKIDDVSKGLGREGGLQQNNSRFAKIYCTRLKGTWARVWVTTQENLIPLFEEMRSQRDLDARVTTIAEVSINAM